ncbi:MAG: hypothetical protein H0X24_13230, partial [Ktedonobacterales bacterium]|nr:hypothetical protein [Ktedonobacterales bacterium]
MSSFAIICRRADPASLAQVVREAKALIGAGHQVEVIAPAWPTLASEMSGSGGRVQVRSLGAAPSAGASLTALVFWVRATVAITAAHLARRYGGIQVVGATGAFVFTTWLTHLLG